jgi:multiple sugar transport system permease protein
VALAPSVAFFAFFAVVPIVNLVRMSFSRVTVQAGVFEQAFIGWDNYAQIPGDATGLTALTNTAVFSAWCVALTVGLGLVLALLVDHSRVVASFARRVLLIPLAIAPVVVSVVWLLMADPSIGSINKLFLTLGLPRQSWLGDPGGAMAVVIAIDVWHWTPLVFLILFTSLQTIDPEVKEAAMADGAFGVRLLRHITLPILAPMVAAVAGVRFLMSFKAFDEMYLVTGGGPGDATTLLALHIRQVFFDQLRLGYGSAYSVMVVVGIGVVIGCGFALRRTTAAARARREARR